MTATAKIIASVEERRPRNDSKKAEAPDRIALAEVGILVLEVLHECRRGAEAGRALPGPQGRQAPLENLQGRAGPRGGDDREGELRFVLP